MRTLLRSNRKLALVSTANVGLLGMNTHLDLLLSVVLMSSTLMLMTVMLFNVMMGVDVTLNDNFLMLNAGLVGLLTVVDTVSLVVLMTVTLAVNTTTTVVVFIQGLDPP